MEGYFPSKMKRKDLEDVNDKFSDFSLSSPARKIRRLDGELPPIVEEEEYEIPLRFKQSVPDKRSSSSNEGFKIEELPCAKEEKAIVLFKPMENPLLKQPSNLSVLVDLQFISELKNQVLQSSQSNSWKLANDSAELDGNDLGSNNGCLAVVPWVPSPLSSALGAEFPPQVDSSEMMDAEEAEEATMDVEDGTVGNPMNVNEASAAGPLHQWQQQHCMIPHHLPHNSTSPIFWSR